MERETSPGKYQLEERVIIGTVDQPIHLKVKNYRGIKVALMRENNNYHYLSLSLGGLGNDYQIKTETNEKEKLSAIIIKVETALKAGALVELDNYLHMCSISGIE